MNVFFSLVSADAKFCGAFNTNRIKKGPEDVGKSGLTIQLPTLNI